MLRKNQMIPLEIEDISHDGSGVGHYEGMAIFVPETALGDRLQVRVLRVNKAFAYGKIEQIHTPSPDRIDPVCPVSRRCGGCVFRHVSYAAQLRYKQRFVQSNLDRIGGFSLTAEPIVPSPEQDGYRNKAQYPIRMQGGRLVAGFFAPRTHEVVDCTRCALQPPFFGDLLETVLGYLRDCAVSIYDEQSGEGLLRHLYLRVGKKSGEVMVCLVVNGDRLPQEEILVERLSACPTQPYRVTSILIDQNVRNTNVILGGKTRLLRGAPQIDDQLCGLCFSLSPQAFYQVNRDGAEQLYAVAAEYAALTGQELLLDLYCGAGTIGLSMAASCRQVIGVEVVAQAVENATENARRNGIANARFLCADAGQAAMQLATEGISPDVVLLDPPRKGCEATVLETVAGMRPTKIVMVSCNSATMARDCRLLAGLGYELTRCRPVDMFPHTAHVESVCLLVRKTESE